MPRPPKRLRTSDHSMAVGISTDPQMSMETDIKLFTHLVGCGLSVEQLSDIPSAQLTNESLATILNIIHDAQRFTKPRTMDGEFKNIDSCQIAISTVSGLADALRDAHDKKSSVPWVNALLLVNLRFLLLTQEELRRPPSKMPMDSQGMKPRAPPQSHEPEFIRTCLHLNASLLINFRSHYRSRYATIVVRLMQRPTLINL